MSIEVQPPTEITGHKSILERTTRVRLDTTINTDYRIRIDRERAKLLDGEYLSSDVNRIPPSADAGAPNGDGTDPSHYENATGDGGFSPIVLRTISQIMAIPDDETVLLSDGTDLKVNKIGEAIVKCIEYLAQEDKDAAREDAIQQAIDNAVSEANNS